MDPVEHWTRQLADWAIPPAILDAAPRNPYEFAASVIRRPTVDPLATPTGRVVLARLAAGERLLDVGCGAGRIAGAFVPGHDVVGIEPRAGLAAVAREVGITLHEGRWPDLAPNVGRAPVVLSTHVMYDVADPVPFLGALHDAAIRRVVLEVTQAHPWAGLGPLYRRFHDLDRPAGPTAVDLAAVVGAVLGVTPQVEGWTRPGSTYDSVMAYADQTARMLCLPPTPALLAEIGALLAADGTVLPGGRIRTPDAHQATLWWDTDDASTAAPGTAAPGTAETAGTSSDG